jgi:DNA-binding CsgD family transcriptional regulator
MSRNETTEAAPTAKARRSPGYAVPPRRCNPAAVIAMDDALAIWPSLTPAERRVVDLLPAGHTNVEIANRLGIALPTVKTHLRHIYAKLGIQTRTALATEAYRQSLQSGTELRLDRS